MDSLSSFSVAVTVASALVVGTIDVWTFRVPNLLTFPLLICGIAFHVITSGASGLQLSLFGAFFGFAVLLFPYLIGGVGGGDVKFMAAVGAWLGMPATLFVFVVAGLATGLYSVMLLAWQGRGRRVLMEIYVLLFQVRAIGRHLGAEERVETVAKSDDRRRRLVPFAAMVAFAMIALLIWQRVY